MPEEKSKEGAKPTVFTSKEGLRPFLTQVLDDCLFNIIHDVVATTHSAEKKLRMQSAAVQVESLALAASGNPPSTPVQANAPASAKPAPVTPVAPPQGQFNTNAALWDNGRVTLKGNPFKLQKENYCPNCKLPRLMFPLTGIGAKIPEDTSRSYCTLHPFIQKPGHDIYGNPFPVDAGKTKKEREALRKLERQEKENTPASTETGNADGESGDPSIRKLMAGGKGATYVPWHTCPNCKRSLLITKFAQHLEKCMGIGGRTSRNAAVARLSSINGNGSQQGSRGGTPAPSQASNSKRDADPDSDKDEGPPKKKFKKDKKDKPLHHSLSQQSLQQKDSKDAKDGKEIKEPKVVLKFKTGGGTSTSTTAKPGEATKRPPKSSSAAQDKSSDHEGGSTGKAKRDREGSGADDLPKKKMRVVKEGGSTTLPEITAGSD